MHTCTVARSSCHSHTLAKEKDPKKQHWNIWPCTFPRRQIIKYTYPGWVQYRDLKHLGTVLMNGHKLCLLSLSLELVDHRGHVHCLLIHLITGHILNTYTVESGT